MLGPVIEGLILADRCCYLNEAKSSHGQQKSFASAKRLFRGDLSPRGIAVTAIVPD